MNTPEALTGQIAAAFPTPPNTVRRALDLLGQARRAEQDKRKQEQEQAGTEGKDKPAVSGKATPEAGRAADDLPRPWDPATCPTRLRADVWSWCEHVAAWLNHEYCWRPDTMIPACWPAHPHIARELAALAVLRFTADRSRSPEPIEEWHRTIYPMFCQRMTDRLGESTCRTGKHTDWPAAARHATYLDTHTTRADAIAADTSAAGGLHVIR